MEKKTRTKIELPPKIASKGKIILAWVVDLILIVLLTQVASKSFPTFLPQMIPIARLLILGVGFFFVMMVIPHALLSQTLAKLQAETALGSKTGMAEALTKVMDKTLIRR